MPNSIFSKAALAIVTACVINFPVLAETADGVTPAVEDVCAGQIGAALGLCNAYCEAMDCDSADALAAPEACGRVRDKYQTLTGSDLPCEDGTCPCNSFTIAPSEIGWTASNGVCYYNYPTGYATLLGGPVYLTVYYNASNRLCRSQYPAIGGGLVTEDLPLGGQAQFDACVTLMDPHASYLENQLGIPCDVY